LVKNIRETQEWLINRVQAVSSKCSAVGEVKIKLKTKYLHFGSPRSLARHTVMDVNYLQEEA
jgi:hypothetical protein